MTDRIKVNARDNDNTKWPSWTPQVLQQRMLKLV